MGSAKKSSSDRKARIAEMRRAEQARERRNRLLTIAASTVVVLGLVVGGVALVTTRDDGDGDAKGAVADSSGAGRWQDGEDGVRTWSSKLSQEHVTHTVRYPMTPPAGGDHDARWMNCDGDVYTEPVPNENAVHSLEHGAVWVTYTSAAKKADVDRLADLVGRTPYTLMSPYEGQEAPLMLTAWGRQRTVTGADDPAVGTFLETYVQGKQTPEMGAVCTGGLTK
jgi:hypothetical protein